MKNLVIIGDSNAVGYWPRNGSVVPVFDNFFVEKNYNFTNLASGGQSNFNSIRKLQSFLSTQPIDLLIWMVTEPYRDLPTYRPGGNHSDDILHTTLNKFESLHALNFQLLKDNFIRLKTIIPAEIPILLIEGLCQTYGIESELPNNCIIIKDWFQRFYNGKMGIISTSQTLDALMRFYVKQKCQMVNEINEIIDAYDAFSIFRQQRPNIWNDGTHFNEDHLKILCNEIYEQIGKL